MTLDGDTAKLETIGQIDLPRWTLSTKHPMSVKSTDSEGATVPSFEISFSGSLDNPTQTFGQGLLQDYLQRKLERKIGKMITDKFGVSGSNNSNSGSNDTPSSDSSPSGPSIEDVAEDALKGLLQGLLK